MSDLRFDLYQLTLLGQTGYNAAFVLLIMKKYAVILPDMKMYRKILSIIFSLLI